MVRMIAGPLAGAVLGFAYYRFIGCTSGACPITSNPWGSMIYGAIMGFVIASMGTGK